MLKADSLQQSARRKSEEEANMAIDVEPEDVENLKMWGLGLHKVQEHCYFCNRPTGTWHRASNTPVCGGCAAAHDRADIARKDVAPHGLAAAI